MELFSRRRRRLVSAQVVSCCVYENVKQYRNRASRAITKVVWQLGRYEPSPPSTKELHGLRLTESTSLLWIWFELTFNWFRFFLRAGVIGSCSIDFSYVKYIHYITRYSKIKGGKSNPSFKIGPLKCVALCSHQRQDFVKRPSIR